VGEKEGEVEGGASYYGGEKVIHKNSEGLPLYLFDRSRLECAADCERRYYWNYGFLGIGIVKARELPPYWPFITGSFIHEGVEGVLLGKGGREAADKAAGDYLAQWLPVINGPGVEPELQVRLQMELEQEVDLVRALVYGWSLVGYPRMLASYQPVEGGIEQEEEVGFLLTENSTISHPIIQSQVEMRLMTRTDILTTSINTPVKQVLLFNLKSTKSPDDRWRNSFSRDMQTLTEAMAVEARLGIKVDGVIIEGLVKGANREYPKGSGFWQSDSMLIYAWVKESDAILPGESGGREYATSWDYTCSQPHVMGNKQRCPGGRNHTLGKGYRKRPVRDCFEGGVYGWIDYLMRNDTSLVESYFVQLPPVNRDEFQVERWKRQHLHKEKTRQDAAALVDERFMANDKEGAYLLLDHYFSQNAGYQCLSCQYEPLCWMAGDPLSESDWKARVPNHLLEAEMLVQVEVKL